MRRSYYDRPIAIYRSGKIPIWVRWIILHERFQLSVLGNSKFKFQENLKNSRWKKPFHFYIWQRWELQKIPEAFLLSKILCSYKSSYQTSCIALYKQYDFTFPKTTDQSVRHPVLTTMISSTCTHSIISPTISRWQFRNESSNYSVESTIYGRLLAIISTVLAFNK